MRSVRVTKDYKAQYPDAPAFKAGESVVCGKSDPVAPGWIWCVGTGGRGAWVPLRIIQRSENVSDGRILEDYEAQELSAKEGETLNILAIESGWAWAENASGRRGWIPNTVLEPISE